MYEPVSQTVQLGALPAWLAAIGKKIVSGTRVTVSTPAGPVVVDLGDPASVAAAKRVLTTAKVDTTVSAGGRSPSPMEQVNQAVTGSVPGGWITVAGGALLAFLVLPKLLRRR